MEQFAWFDLITLGLILILAIKGVINGFIKEVFGLVGIVGGIYLATRFASQAGVWINTNLFTFGNESSMFLIGFLGVLIGFWIVALIVGVMFSKLVDLSGLGFVNRLLGFIVGGAKIFLIFSVIFVAISHVEFIQDNLNKYLKNSKMYPIFVKAGTYIIDIKPDSLPSFASPKQDNAEAESNNDKKIEIKAQDPKKQEIKNENVTTTIDTNISTDTNTTK